MQILFSFLQVDSDTVMVNGVKPVSSEQEELIHSLVYYQEQYEQPSEEDLRRVFNVRLLKSVRFPNTNTHFNLFHFLITVRRRKNCIRGG